MKGRFSKWPWPEEKNAPVAFLTKESGERVAKRAYHVGKCRGMKFKTVGTTRGVIVERVR